MPDPILRVIDFETTGLDRDCHVCEVGHWDLDPSSLEISRGQSYLCRVDHIPPETRAVHHIRASDTRDFPPYDRRCVFEQAVRDGVVGFAAHNAEFEEKWLLGSIPLICTYKAAHRVWPEAPSHSNFGLLYWLEDQGLVDYQAVSDKSHRSLSDSHATAHILRAIYAAGHTGRDLMVWTMEPTLMATCPIGDEWRGKPWADIDAGFLQWILRRVDREDVVWNAQRELDRRHV